MNERGNISIELVLGFSLFVGLLLPAIMEFSEISRANQQLVAYLSVLGRGWSMAPSNEAETTLMSLKSVLAKDTNFSMNYSCTPDCLDPAARISIRLSMQVNSILMPTIKAKGNFARDYFAQ